ncbi:MAG: restriction endonuclease subunit S [Gammaproteobacteria bacterium]|nr:restriction endonuclease subunit S [Gammaproteobacteria bacterium]
MSFRWRTVPMGDEVKFRSGGTPSKSEAKYWDGEIPWVSSGEMTQRRIYDTELHVTEEGAENGTRLVPENTVLVVVRGMSLAKEFRISLTGRPVTFNQDLKALQPSPKIDSGFLFYYLQSQSHAIRDSATDASHGTKKLESRVLETWPLLVPDLTEQYAIRNILSAYDDLIENNRRRIQLLEQAARLLYKEWFVHLRFPGHEHVKIKDGVPEGWEKKPFPDVVDFKEGPGLRNHQYRDQGIPFLNIRTFNDDEIDLSKTKCIDETEVASKYQHFLLDVDDHVVSSSGTLGRVVTIRKCHLPVMLNTSLIRMRPKGVMRKWFLKAYLKYGNFIDQATAMATGAAQLNYGPAHLKVMTVLMPNTQLIELFEEHVSSSYTQIKLLLDSNLQLAKARDLLLPRLMNGGIPL